MTGISHVRLKAGCFCRYSSDHSFRNAVYVFCVVFSVPTLKLLTQHLKIHFHPLPELSSWLVESGQSDRVRQINYKMVSDLEDAVHTADRLQNSSPGRRLMDAHLDGLRQAVDGGRRCSDRHFAVLHAVRFMSSGMFMSLPLSCLSFPAFLLHSCWERLLMGACHRFSGV